LLANCYFRRFLLAWEQHGHQAQLDACVINYADDFVICCKPGNAQAAMARMKALMTRLGLMVNEAKTRIACLPEESFQLPRLHLRSLLQQGRTALSWYSSIQKSDQEPAHKNP